MILTCHNCPRQLAFAGSSSAVRQAIAIAFGWVSRQGEGYLCVSCGAAERASQLDGVHRATTTARVSLFDLGSGA